MGKPDLTQHMAQMAARYVQDKDKAMPYLVMAIAAAKRVGDDLMKSNLTRALELMLVEQKAYARQQIMAAFSQRVDAIVIGESAPDSMGIDYDIFDPEDGDLEAFSELAKLLYNPITLEPDFKLWLAQLGREVEPGPTVEQMQLVFEQYKAQNRDVACAQFWHAMVEYYFTEG